MIASQSAAPLISASAIVLLLFVAMVITKTMGHQQRSGNWIAEGEELLVGLSVHPQRLCDGTGTANYRLIFLTARALRAAIVSVGTMDAPFARQHLIGEITPPTPVRIEGTLPLTKQDHWIRVVIDCGEQVHTYRFCRQL